MNNTLFVTQKRSDAIGIVDNAIKNELSYLKHNFDFLELYEKEKDKLKIIYNYFRSTCKLLWIARKYDQLYFSWENPFVIFVNFFYPKKHIIMTVHHVEDYRWKSKIWKLILNAVDKFIAISKFTKKQLIELWVKSENVTVNYNGISWEFYPEPIQHFQKFPYILYIGTESPRKNTNTLLEVFAMLNKKYPNTKLVKIGKPWEKQAQLLFDQKVKELNIKDSIIINREFVSTDNLRKWYSNALCYVSLSILEGFWLTIPEAMACGCPVVVSDIGPFREICEDSQILVDPMNKNAILAGIEKYINDESFKKNKIQEGIEKARRFNWKDNAKRLIQAIWF